jgi:hypothetical protein
MLSVLKKMDLGMRVYILTESDTMCGRSCPTTVYSLELSAGQSAKERSGNSFRIISIAVYVSVR